MAFRLRYVKPSEQCSSTIASFRPGGKANPMTTPDLTSTLEILDRLIGFDTTSRHSNLAAIAWIEDQLAAHGVESRRIESADRTKANLFATIGPNVEGGVILSGHSDVVPVDGQAWSSDPWKLTERGGRFYGRGTADMKGFLTLALAHVAAFAKGSRPVHLAISYDAEIGCQGAPAMIARMRDECPAPLAAIIGEPSLMQPIDGHKGIALYEVEVDGIAAHSSLPQLGVSANMVAIELMWTLQRLAKDLAQVGDEQSGFEPAHATLTVGLMQGGTAANILAEHASFTFDLRVPPGQSAQSILAPFFSKCEDMNSALASGHPGATIRVTNIADAPPLTSDGSEEAIALVRRLARTNAPAQKVSYAVEAGLFSDAGFAAVICGPGSIEQAHQPDEWIARSQIEAGAQFMQRLAEELR